MEVWEVAAIAGTLAIFAGAAASDLQRRTVHEGWWIALILLGAVSILLTHPQWSPATTALWIGLVLLALEEVVPWPDALRADAPFSTTVDTIAFAAVGAFVAYRWVTPGAGPVPPEIPATLGMIVGARLLYETGVLQGGADAKALMALAIAIPLTPAPVFGGPSLSAAAVVVTPFALTVLIDGALMAAVASLALLAFARLRGEAAALAPPGIYRRAVGALTATTAEIQEFRGVAMAGSASPASIGDARPVAPLHRLPPEERSALLRDWRSWELPLVAFLAGGVVLGLLVGNVVFWLIGGLM